MKLITLVAWLCAACLSGMAWATTPIPTSAPPTPPRVVSLSWEATEHLLKLDITPLAVADANDYRTWYVQPTLPAGVPNVGSRTEPNLEWLATLKPDLIIISPLLQDMRPTLERIAPVMLHASYSQDDNNLQLQRQAFLAVAQRLGRSALAQARLQAMDVNMARMRTQLQQRFGRALPAVAVVRFSSLTAVLFNGPNSMPQHALDALGLQAAYTTPSSAWGITLANITTLGQVRQGVVLHIEPFAQQAQLFATPLWQAMPFVKARRFAALPSIWTYGGVFSVERLAQAITDALLNLQPAQRGDEGSLPVVTR